jgi:hypothetical protein
MLEANLFLICRINNILDKQCERLGFSLLIMLPGMSDKQKRQKGVF